LVARQFAGIGAITGMAMSVATDPLATEIEQMIYGGGCAVPDTEYTIVLRRAAAQGGAVFVVADRRGDAFIFSARGLCGAPPHAARSRLAARAERRAV